MSWFVQAIGAGITSFIATNLDDIVILMIFFAQVNATFRPQHIVLGQYVGFLALVLASLPGFFGGLLVPKAWIGLLGLVPIAIGIYQLFHRESREDEVQEVSEELAHPHKIPVLSALTNLLNPKVYGVAAVTVANGGDNIGIYVPLFASCTLASLGVILGSFFVMVGLWCYIAYLLTQHPVVGQVLTRYGRAIVPFVLIGLGLFILLESGTFQLLQPGTNPN